MSSKIKDETYKVLTSLYCYFLAVFLGIVILIIIFQLWKADLAIPFIYDGDIFHCSLIIKSIIENGWYYENSHLGLPFSFQYYDFPTLENFQILTFKLLSIFTSNWALIQNLYLLLSFPITIITSLFVLRKLSISNSISIVISILYAFAPYHFFRFGHLFLSVYFMIPIGFLILLWVLEGKISFFVNKGDSKVKLNKNKTLIFVVISLLIIGSSGLYYAYYLGGLFLVIGLIFSINFKDKLILKNSFIAILILVTALLCNMLPTIINGITNGKNKGVAIRSALDSESSGLKITSMLFPISEHRIPAFSKLKSHYVRHAVPDENNNSSLGIIASIGFILLIVALFNRKRWINSDFINRLSIINIILLLYGTVSGFSVIFAYILPQIRAHNRISILIAFISLLSISVLLEKLYSKFRSKNNGRFKIILVSIIILVFGIMDQTQSAYFNYEENRKIFNKDLAYVNNIESLFTDRAKVFQLPYMEFPESPSINRMNDYNHLKLYLLSSKLDCSYPSMKGREGSLWQLSLMEEKDINEIIKILYYAGFNGIHIDTFGYQDAGAEIVSNIQNVLSSKMIKSDDGRYIFISIPDKIVKYDEDRNNYIFINNKIPVKKGNPCTLPSETNNINYCVDDYYKDGNYYRFSGWAYVTNCDSVEYKKYLILHSSDISYRFNLEMVKRPDRAEKHNNSPIVLHAGFRTSIAKQSIKEGSYKVGLLIECNNIASFQFLDVKDLIIEGKN